MEERKVILQDLPTSVRGFVFLDDTGEPVVVLNARLSREQNRRTLDHERKHIAAGDLGNLNFHEYGGNEP